MIDALISGKLIRDPQVKTSSNGNPYVQFLMSVSKHGEADTQFMSGIGFDEAEITVSPISLPLSISQKNPPSKI